MVSCILDNREHEIIVLKPSDKFSQNRWFFLQWLLSGLASDEYEIDPSYQSKKTIHQKKNQITSKEKLSVIIPTFNRWKNLQKAVESVENQTYENIEIIVINDCSTDIEYHTEKLELKNTYTDKTRTLIRIDLPINNRIKYNYPIAQGMTRNEGLKIATGEWIAFLDDDDYWYPHKIETQLKALKEENLFFCSTNMLKGHGMYGEYNPDECELFFKTPLPRIFTRETIATTNYVNCSSVLVHASLVQQVGNFKLVQYEDYTMWQEILEFTNCLYLEECTMYYDMDNGKGRNYKKW